MCQVGAGARPVTRGRAPVLPFVGIKLIDLLVSMVPGIG